MAWALSGFREAGVDHRARDPGGGEAFGGLEGGSHHRAVGQKQQVLAGTQ